jgi:hypothetical protein
VGGLLAVTVSLGMAFAMELLDPSFRTPAEVQNELNIPVLAAIPVEREGFYRNGNGNGNGRGVGSSNDDASGDADSPSNEWIDSQKQESR